MAGLLGIVLPWWWRWAMLGAVVASSMAGGAYLMHRHDEPLLQKALNDAAEFRGGVAAVGIQAQREKDRRIAEDKKREESANEALKTARATADSANRGWMQLAQSRAGSGYLPAAGPGASEPQGACVNRAQFERAMGELDAEGARIAAEGDSCTVTLNNARAWAKARD